MSLATAATIPTRAVGLTPATGARIVDALRDAGLIRPGKRRHPPMWTEADYASYHIATVTYRDLNEVADRTRTYGALEYSGSRGLRGAMETEKGALLGPGTFREVLVRLLRRAARRLVTKGAGQGEACGEEGEPPPWPDLFRFHLHLPYPVVNIFWLSGPAERCDNYTLPHATPPTAPLTIARTADVASDLLSTTAEALVAELARHGVDPAAHLSTSRRSDT